MTIKCPLCEEDKDDFKQLWIIEDNIQVYLCNDCFNKHEEQHEIMDEEILDILREKGKVENLVGDSNG